MALDLVADYISNPSNYFGKGHRQAQKLERKMSKLCSEIDMEIGDLVENILAAARLRVRYAQPTIYIQNIGSSGSHWLKEILGGALDLLTSREGEIYINKPFLKGVIGAMHEQDAKAAMQAIMLAHVFSDKPSVISRSIVNTAHVPALEAYTRRDIQSYKVLLIRDPVDIVISRTFRKNEYRSYLGLSDVSDAEYARQNIKRVNQFFNRALRTEHDLVCSYESMLAGPENIKVVVEQLARDLSLSFDREKVQSVVERTISFGDGEKVVETNRYKGELVEVSPNIYEMIVSEMQSLRERLGYLSA